MYIDAYVYIWFCVYIHIYSGLLFKTMFTLGSETSTHKRKNKDKSHQGINLLFSWVHVSQPNIHNILGRYAGSHPGESWYIRDLKW